MIRNYRGLAGHLRHNTDLDHRKLRARWTAWRGQYRKSLRCRKCGGTWEVRDKTQSNRKRCPRCEDVRAKVGKRAYERQPTARLVDSVPPVSRVVWERKDKIYQMVVEALVEGERVRDLMHRLALTYKVVRTIGEDAFGVGGYRELAKGRKRRTASMNLQLAHEQYQALSAKEKARVLKRRFGGTCALERKLAGQLREEGVTAFQMNQWQSIPIDGIRVPREADIKVDVGDGRKVVVLCDGEAFHGPKAIYGSADARIESDRKTALGFFGLGYSVARYSETEVHEGFAVAHLCGLLSQLQEHTKIYRNWCPFEELAL